MLSSVFDLLVLSRFFSLFVQTLSVSSNVLSWFTDSSMSIFSLTLSSTELDLVSGLFSKILDE